MAPALNATQANQSGEKLLRIIELLAARAEPMRVLDIARELQLNSSTALRFLMTLKNCGYADQDPETSRYYLTFKLCNIAGKISAAADLRDIVQPYLKKLPHIFGESACLAVERDMLVTYIDVAEGPDLMIRSMQRIGSVAPMHCTGIGKLLLLNASEADIDRLIAEKGLPRYTENTITSKEQLHKELEQVRARGYAFDNEECEVGARCIAFPIRDYTGKVKAGLSITGPTSRLTDSFIESRLHYLFEFSEAISRKLGYEENSCSVS